MSYALQRVRLSPCNSPLQQVVSWGLDVVGGQIEAGYFDHYGNHVHLIGVTDETQRVEITVSGEIDTQDQSGVLGKVYGRAPLWHFKSATRLTKAGPMVRDMSQGLADQSDPIDALHALSARILQAVPYHLDATGSATTAEEAISLGKGVCQDHANIFVAAARHAGVPARYVSGYLQMNDRIDQDASHAWAEAHVEGLGWIGFDVSNGYCPDERYVRLAIGRDAHDAAPVSGLRLGSGAETLNVTLQVQQ